ncbi:hypothetical protein Tco_1116856, partial [Tanacetum coccineum]
MPLCLLRNFYLRSNLEYKSFIKRQHHEESIDNAIQSWSVGGSSLQLVRKTLVEPSHPLSYIDEEDIDLISAPLTPLVKSGDGIHSIDVGCLETVRVAGGEEVVLHAVNCLIEDRGDDVGLSMLLVDFKNALNLIDRKLDCVMGNTPYGHTKDCIRAWYLDDDTIIEDTSVAWYLDDGTIIGDTLVVGRSRLVGVFPPNIARPLHGVKSLCEPASVDFDFSSELMMNRVAKTILHMDVVAKINHPQCELLLLHAWA